MRNLLLILILLCFQIPAGLTQYLSGISNAWAVGTYSDKHTDIYSIIANPAALIKLKEPGLAIIGERKY